jgi:hypothetical protein
MLVGGGEDIQMYNAKFSSNYVVLTSTKDMRVKYISLEKYINKNIWRYFFIVV